MALFLISASRAVVEMLLWVLLGQGVLHVLVGRQRMSNPIYRLFDLLTMPPRRLVLRLLPASPSPCIVGVMTFVGLFALWFGLALLRKGV